MKRESKPEPTKHERRFFRRNMDALADYSSDDESPKTKDKIEKKKRGGDLEGDNYETVTMDLSEGSDDNKETSRASKESEKSDRGKRGRRHDEERKERRLDSRHHKSKHSKNRDERRDDREKRDRREDRYKSDRDRKRSRRSRSRSRSPRRRSRSRDRVRDKNRDFKSRKNPPTVESAPPSTSGVDKDRSLSPPIVKSTEAIQLSAGIVPGFTNNPTLARIQDQLQKRRALWSNKSAAAKETPAPSGNNWESTHLPKDGDGKMTAKFKRLMGMKVPMEAGEPSVPEKPLSAADQQKKQDDMFNSMERQYEVARLATHTHRGIGLGFGTFQCNPR